MHRYLYATIWARHLNNVASLITLCRKEEMLLMYMRSQTITLCKPLHQNVQIVNRFQGFSCTIWFHFHGKSCVGGKHCFTWMNIHVLLNCSELLLGYCTINIFCWWQSYLFFILLIYRFSLCWGAFRSPFQVVERTAFKIKYRLSSTPLEFQIPLAQFLRQPNFRWQKVRNGFAFIEKTVVWFLFL